MTMVDVDDKLYQEIDRFVKKNKIDYTSIRDFVNKSIKLNLERGNNFESKRAME